MNTNSPLLTDFYQFTMLQAYFNEGMNDTAVFEFFIRKMPECRNFFMVAGTEQVLHYLQTLEFTNEDIAYLQQDGRFSGSFLDFLKKFKFSGDVNGMAEGTIVFPNEPIIQVIAPLAQAQLIESRLINLLQFQTMIASKAARCRLNAPEKLLVDFGMRRAHGAEAALLCSRANYIAGFDGTATVLAAKEYKIPSYGTMAHSYIQAHANEMDAFYGYAKSHPQAIVLLIDTYDTEKGAKKVTELAKRLGQENIFIKAVRLDSGDLGEHALKVRKILDTAGCNDIDIFCSGDLDEYKIAKLKNFPIDGFGVGTKLDTSNDAPYLDCAYKLQLYAGQPKRKKSEGKITWPGQKQVYRDFENHKMQGDIVTLCDDNTQKGVPLLKPLMRAGKIISSPTIAEIKINAQQNLHQLPLSLTANHQAQQPYEVKFSESLYQLARKVDLLLDN